MKATLKMIAWSFVNGPLWIVLPAFGLFGAGMMFAILWIVAKAVGL